MLELYHHNTSVCAVKVRLTLSEKELDWKGHYIDIIAGEQFTPAFAAINPKCEVPVLVHDGRVVRESALIDEYLDEAFPEVELSPRDPHDRFQMRLWARIPDDGIHFACADLTFAVHHRHRILEMSDEDRNAFLAKTQDPTLRERKKAAVLEGFETPFIRAAVELYERTLDRMNVQLETTEWLVGERYSLADIALTPYVNRLWMFGYGEDWRKSRPALSRWFEAVRERPNFREAVSDWHPEELTHAMLTNGQKCIDEYRDAAAAAA